MATWFRYFRLDLPGQKGSAGPLLLECAPAQAVVGLCLDATIREPEFTPMTPAVSSAVIPWRTAKVLESMGPEGSWPQATHCLESALPLGFLGSGLYSHHLLTCLPLLSNELSGKTFHVFFLEPKALFSEFLGFRSWAKRVGLGLFSPQKTLRPLSTMVYLFSSDQHNRMPQES